LLNCFFNRYCIMERKVIGLARSSMIPQHLISCILLTNITGCLAEICSLPQSLILSVWLYNFSYLLCLVGI
jgi:hypothetical protein